MGTMFASCGHRIGLEWFLNPKSMVTTGGYDYEGHCLIYSCVCKRCRREYEKDKIILKTKKQQDKWMKS